MKILSCLSHKSNQTCVERGFETEAIARPSALLRDNISLMFYTYRGSSDFRDGEDAYKIGIATTTDKQFCNWKRQDNLITIPRDSFDSTMGF